MIFSAKCLSESNPTVPNGNMECERNRKIKSHGIVESTLSRILKFAVNQQSFKAMDVIGPGFAHQTRRPWYSLVP